MFSGDTNQDNIGPCAVVEVQSVQHLAGYSVDRRHSHRIREPEHTKPNPHVVT